MIIDVQKEKLAGYISENNEIYSDAPDFIKEMARAINEDHRKMFFDTDFFTFIDEKYGEPLPSQIKIRKELEADYKA